MNLNSFARAIDAISEISPEMHLQTAAAFVLIGLNGVCDQKTVERSLGMSNACASRSIDYWTRTGRKKLDFVKRYPDPDDRRRNLVKLTRKGQALFDRLRAI